MPLLLNIDTATEHAGVCLSKDDTVLGLIESAQQKNHASFLQPAIQQLMNDAGFSLPQLDAIAVTSGPGSYTGLRVGLASAKGICYALQKQLILVNTLEVMAQSMLDFLQNTEQDVNPSAQLCPLIDARRMEVFTALYDFSLREKQAPHALVIDADSFSSVIQAGPVFFSGSGSDKAKKIISAGGAVFLNLRHNASHLAVLAAKAYRSAQFADLAYSEPLYVKEFFDTSKKDKT